MSTRAASPAEALRKALLLCGVLSSVYHLGVNAYVPAQWPGYSVISQVVSELSAIDAPTRPLWVTLMVPYTILLLAFGAGIVASARDSRLLRTVGWLYMANAIVGAFWPPMHQRGAEMSLTDTLHIAWSMAWLLVMLTCMVLAARALGRPFRLYTIATLVVFVVFGTLTSIAGADLAAGVPTPWIGLWERVNMAAGMLWTAVLAVALLRRPVAPTASSPRS